jgi:hypothetical protein
VLLLANPMNDHVLVGSAYMRFGYLGALALGLVALRGRWFATCGVLFAVSGWLRIFPLVFPALLLARDFVDSRRWERLRSRARLHGSFALASLVILVVTSGVDTPSGRNPWLAFVENMSLHSGMLAGNQIGLEVPFRYSAANDFRPDPEEPRVAHANWREEAARSLHERRFAYYLAAALLSFFALASVRRGRDESVFFAGMLMVYALMPLAHYYYAVLSLGPLAVGCRRRDVVLLTGTLGALALTCVPSLLLGSEDLRFTLINLLVLAYLLVATFWSGRAAAPQTSVDFPNPSA